MPYSGKKRARRDPELEREVEETLEYPLSDCSCCALYRSALIDIYLSWEGSAAESEIVSRIRELIDKEIYHE